MVLNVNSFESQLCACSQHFFPNSSFRRRPYTYHEFDISVELNVFLNKSFYLYEHFSIYLIKKRWILFLLCK